MKGYLEKLSKILLFLFLFLIPTQLGKHFWPEASLVLGIRIDYLSPTLYLIDLVWLGLFILNPSLTLPLTGQGKQKRKPLIKIKYILMVGFVVINILMAMNKQVAIYGWLRIFQMGWMIWFLNKNKKIVKDFLVKIIPIWIILEGGLAIGQMSKGASLNGIWWWLGERSFDFNTIGVAQMSVVGNGLIRAYGTFSHPNSLAGFLLVSLVWWVKLKENNNRILWWGVFWLGLVGIVLTGSRTVWGLTLVILIWFFSKNFKKIKTKWKGMVAMLVLLFLVFKIINFNYTINGFLSGWDENGLLKRGQLNLAALEMIKESPIFGVGIKNFLVNLPEFQKNNQIFWLQPVHNILLLLVSEVGLLGLGGIIWWLIDWYKVKKLEKEDLLIVGVIILSGMMDHYWLTLPQNIWLLTLVIGII